MPSTYLSLHVHIVFATRDRAPMIDEQSRPELHAYIGGAINGLGAKPLAVGGVADHVHILAGLRATHCVADLVREVKGTAGTWAKERYARFGWQGGYAAFSVGHSELPIIAGYIEGQEEHHRELSSYDELKALLEEFRVEYDPQYFE